MSVSTDAELSYGVLFDEDYEFPWDSDKYDFDIDEWWMDAKGFKPKTPCPFTDEGQYREGITKESEEIDAWFAERREWRNKNPAPVILVNYCSGDYPMYIVAVRSTTANRGFPAQIDQEYMDSVTDDDKRNLREFLEFAGIEDGASEPSWWLSSYWG